MKLVYIIILNWNGWRDTLECIQSCIKLTYANFRILVVDNGSTDDSVAAIRQNFPDIELLETGVNLGFAGGNNRGIKRALEENADFLWLLNNDTVVDRNALSELMALAESNNQIGVVGSKIFFYDKPKLLWFAGGSITKLTKLAYHFGHHQEDGVLYQTNRDVDFITGCSYLINRSTVQQVGYMREEYFLYGEDTDWCIRIAKAGWRITWASQSRVWHKVSSSHGAANPFLYYYCVRNILRYVKLNHASYLPFTFAAVFFIYILKPLAKLNFAISLWSFRGLLDYLFGHFGEYRKPIR